MRTTLFAAMWLWAVVGVVVGQGPPPPRNPTSTSCVAAKNLSVVQAWSAGVNFSTTSPHLRLGIVADNTAHYLFVPALLPQ